MGDVFQRTRNQGNFTKMEYADGLFFQKGLARPTIRIEAPSIAMVFTDGPALGYDLDGFLSFIDINALGSASYYVLSEQRDPNDLSYYAKVEFFSGLNPNPYPVFLARDIRRIVDTSLNNAAVHYGSGQWAKLDIGASTAVMEKTTASTVVTITARSIHI